MIQQKQIKPKEPIPEFKTIQEEAEFWHTHDVGEYLNDFKRIDVELQLEKPKRGKYCRAGTEAHQRPP